MSYLPHLEELRSKSDILITLINCSYQQIEEDVIRKCELNSSPSTLTSVDQFIKSYDKELQSTCERFSKEDILETYLHTTQRSSLKSQHDYDRFRQRRTHSDIDQVFETNFTEERRQFVDSLVGNRNQTTTMTATTSRQAQVIIDSNTSEIKASLSEERIAEHHSHVFCVKESELTPVSLEYHLYPKEPTEEPKSLKLNQTVTEMGSEIVASLLTTFNPANHRGFVDEEEVKSQEKECKIEKKAGKREIEALKKLTDQISEIDYMPDKSASLLTINTNFNNTFLRL
jgi:hypothetical protein